MKAIMEIMLAPRRGGEVLVGNVYANRHGRPFYKVVLSIVKDKRYNNVACLHIAATGDIVGCSMQPPPYLSNHHDLVGQVTDLPDFKIEWFKQPCA